MAKTNATLVWKIADLLRRQYQPNQCGKPSEGPVDDNAVEIDHERLLRDIR